MPTGVTSQPNADCGMGLAALSGAVRNGVFLDMEADFRFGGRRRRGHELADGVEDYLELGVVFLFQVLEASLAGLDLRADGQSDLNQSPGRCLLARARLGEDEIHVWPDGQTAAVIRQMRQVQCCRLPPDKEVRQDGTVAFGGAVLAEPLACSPGGVKVQPDALEWPQIFIHAVAVAGPGGEFGVRY